MLKRLLPFDPAPILDRTTAPWPAHPLEGKPCAVGGSGALADALRKLLTGAGADADSGGKLHAIVFDATGTRDSAGLEALRSFVGGSLSRLAPSGRVVIIGAESGDDADAMAYASQAALTGFTRSLAKEIGRRGATAQLLYVPARTPAADAARKLAGPVLFFLSARAAFVTGQVVRLTPGAAPEKISFPEIRPLEGKRAIVTGAARGIGAAIARTLAQEGAWIMGVDHPTQKDALEEVMREVSGYSIGVDLSGKDAVSTIADEVDSRWGGVDILVNNAGVTRDKTLAKMTKEMWDMVLRINLEVPLRLMEALPLEPGGRVIFLSSVVGIAGNFGQTNYTAAKAGLMGAVASESPRLAGRGITVNAIAPGFIDTPMTRKMPFIPREVGRRLSSLKQGGIPEDVAHCAAFLASPGAFAVSGATIRVCGQSLLGA